MNESLMLRYWKMVPVLQPDPSAHPLANLSLQHTRKYLAEENERATKPNRISKPSETSASLRFAFLFLSYDRFLSCFTSSREITQKIVVQDIFSLTQAVVIQSSFLFDYNFHNKQWKSDWKFLSNVARHLLEVNRDCKLTESAQKSDFYWL